MASDDTQNNKIDPFSRLSLQFTHGQLVVLERCLVRRGIEAVKDIKELPEWLTTPGKLITAKEYVELITEPDPLDQKIDISKTREYVLCYMSGIDCFSKAYAEPLIKFLNEFDPSPNILVQSKELLKIQSSMNRIHRVEVEKVHNVISRAFRRFNDNSSLGRPLITSLDILYEELLLRNAFSGGVRANPELDQLFLKIKGYIERNKAGKANPENILRNSVVSLEKVLKQSFQDLSDYWYNEKMIKYYVRDILIPHAIINQYIDPQKTTDFYGGIWNFTQDIKTKDDLLVCPELLKHQPVVQGARFTELEDFVSEINFSDIKPENTPLIADRITVRLEKINSQKTAEKSIKDFLVRPSLRLSHDPDFLLHLLSDHLKNSQITENKFNTWLQRSLFAIDPRNGVLAQVLAEILSEILSEADLLNNIKSLDIISINKSFHDLLNAKFMLLKEAIAQPFIGEYFEETGKLDPFELNETMVDLVAEGCFQINSDWDLERELATRILDASEAINKIEKENRLSDIDFIKPFFVELRKSIDKLEESAKKIKIDLPSLKLWKLFCIDIIATNNNITIEKLLSLDINSELLIPVNTLSYKKLTTPKIQAELELYLHEVASL